ncbi:MAG: hypothetical protein MRZ79_21870 [Bacteroidia bacterium]|nr:hypothetical protein [Bacteroidia bacterium]
MRIKQTIIVALFSLFTLQGMAQGVVKLAPLKLFNGKIAVGYEHVLNDNWTAGVGLQVVMPNNLDTFNEGLQDAFTNSQDLNFSDRLQFSGFSRKTGVKVTPEARYYFSGNAPKGFYAMGFARYTRTAWGWENTYTTTNGEVVNYSLTTPVTVAGLGVGLGVQAIIADVVTIDWNTGLGGAAYALGINGEISAPTAEGINEFFNDIENGLGEEFLNTVTTNTVNESLGTITTPSLILISRLSVGFYIR